MVRVEEFTVADEGVRLASLGEHDLGGVELPDHHVVDVVAGPGVRAVERGRIVAGSAGAATGADDARPGAVHTVSDTPERALKSSIRPSQIGISSRSPRQNPCDRRATKSSIDTPCCSTHV